MSKHNTYSPLQYRGGAQVGESVATWLPGSSQYKPSNTVSGNENTNAETYKHTFRFTPPTNIRWQGIITRVFLVEFLAAFFLQFSVYLAVSQGADVGTVALVRGLLTGAFVYTWFDYGKVALLPQVSMATFVLGLTHWARLLSDLVAQFGGGFLAAGISNAMLGNGAITVPTTSPLQYIGQWWLIELLFGLLVTSVFIWTSYGTDRLYVEGSARLRTPTPGPNNHAADVLLPSQYKHRTVGPRSLALGAAAAAALVVYGSCLVTGPLTGGSFTFLTFIPQLFHSNLTNFTPQVLLFLFAPLVSGILAIVVFALVIWITRMCVWDRKDLSEEEMTMKNAELGMQGRGLPQILENNEIFSGSLY